MHVRSRHPAQQELETTGNLLHNNMIHGGLRHLAALGAIWSMLDRQFPKYERNVRSQGSVFRIQFLRELCRS